MIRIRFTSSSPRRTRPCTTTARSLRRSCQCRRHSSRPTASARSSSPAPTGECHSLTCDERLALYDAWAAAGPAHGLAVIAHVGANSIEDAQAFWPPGARARLSPLSLAGAVVFQAARSTHLIDVVCARSPAKPLTCRSITTTSRPDRRVAADGRFLTGRADRIPNLAGIKFTNPDLVSYRRSLDVAGERFDLPWGIDEALLGALATGARGAVGSTYNWAPKLYIELDRRVPARRSRRGPPPQSISIAMVEAIAATGFMGTARR